MSSYDILHYMMTFYRRLTIYNYIERVLSIFFYYRITDREGNLSLKKRFDVLHTSHSVKSTFCPIMSFRRGVCVVSGSEDSCVYFLDIEGHAEHPVVNKLQGDHDRVYATLSQNITLKYSIHAVFVSLASTRPEAQ